MRQTAEPGGTGCRASLRILDLGRQDYGAVLALQEQLVAQALAARATPGQGTDTLLLVEHPPVFTLGRGADERHLLPAAASSGTACIRVSRGGGVTYHGPGQLVGYLICDLARRGTDLHRYLRELEETLCQALRPLGVQAHRRLGLTGLWVGPRKLASIGIGVRRWVTWHGFALNVTGDLSAFGAIVPCGMHGLRMTSVSEVLGVPVSVRTVQGLVAWSFLEWAGKVGRPSHRRRGAGNGDPGATD